MRYIHIYYIQLHGFLAIFYMVYWSYTHSFAVPRQVLGSKGVIADPDQPCHSALDCALSSSSSQ